MEKEEFERIKETYEKQEKEAGYRTQRSRLEWKREYMVLLDVQALIEEVERLQTELCRQQLKEAMGAFVTGE